MHFIFSFFSFSAYSKCSVVKNITLRGFPGDSVVKNPPANVGDMRSIPGSERCPGGGNGNTLQYACLGTPWTEEPGGLQPMWPQRVRQDKRPTQKQSLFYN